MQVLVTGGDGFIGQNLCRELVSRGHDVTVLSRNPDASALPDGVRTVTGDVTSYASVEAAFDGQDAVVNLVALSPLFEPKGGNRMHDIVHRQGTENVIRAAAERNVRRLVQMSALGADPDGPTAYLRSKGRAEDAVRESNLEWVVFRPSVVFGDGSEFLSFTRTLAPPYVTPLPGGGKTRFQPIWVGDFVPVVADAVEDDEHVGQTYEIGGPEVLTLADVARHIHASEGRSTNVVPIPMSLARLGLTVGGAVPGFPMGPDQYRSLQLDHTTPTNDADAFGRSEADLKSLGEFIRQRESG